MDAFHKNDMVKAVELGKLFLSSGDLKTSAFQLLGVKVMIGLAGGAQSGAMFENREDQEEKKRLDSERAAITKRYRELTAIYRDGDARINELTLNRRRPVPEGSPNHLECLECARRMDAALAEMETMKVPIEQNKQRMAEIAGKADSGLKPQTLELLDMLIEADEIEAAFAIANTYIRQIGNDFDVAKKQQDVVRLQELADKASKIVAILQAEIGELVTKKFYWEAKEKTSQFVGKVEQMNNDKNLHRMVRARIALDTLGVEKQIKAGDESYRLIKGLSESDFTRAFTEFENFKENYPDYPGRQELDLWIASVKVKSMDQIIAKLDSDFEDLQKRIDPEKLRLFISSASSVSRENSTTFTKQRDVGTEGTSGLMELGLAPADARLVQSKLQGMAAAVSVVEKIGVPPDRLIKLAEIKSTVLALLYSTK